MPYATPAQIERTAALGLVVSVQDAGYRPVAASSLAPSRLLDVSPIRALLDRGIVVVGGSDYNGPTPAERATNNPFLPFSFYVTRRTSGGDALAQNQRISRADALRLFTANAAYAQFQEARLGSITPGKLADFVILDRDIMTVAEDRLATTRPIATFVGGRKVFTAPHEVRKP